MNFKHKQTFFILSTVIILVLAFSYAYYFFNNHISTADIVGEYSVRVEIGESDPVEYDSLVLVTIPNNKSTISLNETEIDSIFDDSTNLDYVFINDVSSIIKGKEYKKDLELLDEADVLFIAKDIYKNYYIGVFSDLPEIEDDPFEIPVFQISNTEIPFEIPSINVSLEYISK